MKTLKFILAVLFFLIGESAFACDVCKNKQPKILQDVTHGTGPEGNSDYIIIWSAVVIVATTLFLSLKYLLKPKENDEAHIKNIVTEKM